MIQDPEYLGENYPTYRDELAEKWRQQPPHSATLGVLKGIGAGLVIVLALIGAATVLQLIASAP